MVTARLAIGSVSTLALGALVLGAAPYWLNRGGSGTHASPWGIVSALGAAQSAAAQSEGERAQLLKLAALKSGTAAEPTSSVVLPAPMSPQAADPAPVPTPAVQTSVAPAQLTAQETPGAALPQSAAPAEASQQVASLDASAPADTTQDDGAAKSDRININTASPNTLDHLPGAGHIGRTIVSHRPYKSVKDLVSRRVLRTSDFQKIQSHISVD